MKSRGAGLKKLMKSRGAGLKKKKKKDYSKLRHAKSLPKRSFEFSVK